MQAVVQNDVTAIQYEKEIARLDAQVERLQEEKEELQLAHQRAVGIIEDNIIQSHLSAIELERWLNRHVLPKMRARADAQWFLDQLAHEEDLGLMIHSGCLIHSHEGMVMPGDLPGFDENMERLVNPVINEEYVTWGFLSTDESTLRQFREQEAMCEETGLQVVYDNEGLAQPPRQVIMSVGS